GKLEIAEDKANSLLIIDELDLEQYLVGLINLEISSQWSIEAVKAQAVVARTYALYKRQRRQEEFYDLEASVLDQVYAGSNPEDQRSRYAVRQTRGEVIAYQGQVVPAYFHSNCGGRTEASRYLWSREDYPFLRGVKCDFCTEAPDYFWSYRLSLKDLERVLRRKGVRVNGIQAILVAKQTSSNRALLLEITSASGKTNIKGEKFRGILGSTKIKSTNFQVKIEGGKVYFHGSGYGHGVGLCQWGSKGMAEKGHDYRSILKYYYPGVEIKRLY
ncbi:MAG: SpoIID/LytB domain-containing protein, partial [Deltaproteobacteria bacterium]